MVTAEELTLAIRSEGVGDTRDDLEGVEQAMDETAESAGDSAEELQGFSERFAGAMGAAVTALAVGAAGLLSQVPVLGEVFSGLAAIVSALAFQMDGVLRPVLSPLTDAFFTISAAIFEAEDAAGDIIGVVATLVSIALAAAGIMYQLGISFAAVTSAAGTIAGALTTVGSVVAGLISTLAGLISLPAVIAAAFVALAAALIFNIGGARDKLGSIIGDIMGFFGDLAAGARDVLIGVVDAFLGLGARLAEWAGSLAATAREWGVQIVSAIIDGVRGMANNLLDALVDLANEVLRSVNTVLDALPDEVTSTLGVEAFDTLDDVSIGGTDTGTGGGGGGGGATPTAASAFAGRSGGRGGGTQLDGRQLTESTGRYRSDPARRQGL